MKLTSFDILERNISDETWNNFIKRLDYLWEAVTSEITYLVYIGGFTSTDVKTMPVPERKFHYNFIMTARQKEKEEIEKKVNSSKKG